MAARDAQLHEDIMQREGGYQYRITEGGRNFSGGQRQRMEIARVLLQNPSIIILDEATSELDERTEYEVVKSIKDRGITCIVVPHRLSTIRNCDEIIVLDNGKAVERGTHEELLVKDSLYAKFVMNEEKLFSENRKAHHAEHEHRGGVRRHMTYCSIAKERNPLSGLCIK